MANPAGPRSTSLLLLLALAPLACDPAGVDEDLAVRGEVADPDHVEGCTHTDDWWKSQNQKWPQPNSVVCDETWLEILQTPPDGFAWYGLAHQWIAASLNIAAGASPPDDVSLGQAEMLLSDCMIDPDEYEAAVALTDALAAYNAGEDGPDQCGDDRPINDPQ